MNEERKQELIRVYETLPTDTLKDVLKRGTTWLGGSRLIKAELLRRNIPENELPSDSELKRVFVTNLRNAFMIGVILVCGVGLIIFVSIYDFTPERKSNSLSLSKPNGYTAYYQSQYYVKQQLKSPSSAIFPNPLEVNGLLGTDLGNGRFEVTAYVDAQNSFGVMSRNRYTCVLQGYETDSDIMWVMESIKID